MKPKITARSLRRWQLLVLALFGLALAACANARSTAATPTVQTALIQTATRVATQYVTATPSAAVSVAMQTPEVITTPTPAGSSLSVVWSTDVANVKASFEEVWSASWISGNEVEINVDEQGYLIVSADSGAILTATPESQSTSYPPPDEALHSYSPNRAYVIECRDDGLSLFRIGDRQPLSQFSIQLLGCYAVNWAADSSQAVFVNTNNGEAFIWPVNGKPPQQVKYGGYVWAAQWSPDAMRLLLVRSWAEPEVKATVQVVYPDGTPAVNHGIEIEAGGGWVPESVKWVTNDVIMNLKAGYWWYSYAFYDAHTGQFMADSFYLEKVLSSEDWFSPDKHWVVLSDYNGRVKSLHMLLDLETRDLHRLADDPDTYLEFVSWLPDSSTFYMISRPTDATAPENPNVPLGLLALNPQSREFTPLFEQAVFAKLRPDKKLAWVVFPAKHADGTLGLDGGVFDLAAGTLAGRQFVSDRVLYANPAEGDLAPVAWSNDGTRVVFGDSLGNLILVRMDGTPQVLATNLPHDDWPANVHYAWSPDDRHLLVQYGDRAWIVTVP